MRAKICILTLAAALLLLCACGDNKEPVQTVDPYEGMVEVESGFGTKMWVELYEDVPVSTFSPSDFRREGTFISYTGGGPEALRGIDVSEHQKGIDWELVAAQGIDFAMIRAGYRGYSQGGLYEDEYFRQNISLAMDNGVEVGVYFFSQAVTPEEAVEEAEYLLELIGESGAAVTMPVAFDWENIDNDDARTDELSGAVLTDCAVAFCERIKQAGYTPAVYAYRYLAYFRYDLPRLTDYQLWIGAIGDSPDFYYRHDIWQYSAEGQVRGIEGPVDLNLLFREKQDGSVQPAAAPESPDAYSAPPEPAVTPEQAPEAEQGAHSEFKTSASSAGSPAAYDAPAQTGGTEVVKVNVDFSLQSDN